MRNTPIHAISLGMILIFISACTLPAPNTPQPTDAPGQAETIAAQTIIAEFTKEAPTTEADAAVDLPTATATTPAESTEPPAETPLPTSTPTPEGGTPEPSPSPTHTPTATWLPSDPRSGLGDPDWIDSFDSAVNWPLYKDSHVSFEIKQSAMFMTALNPDKYNGWIITQPVLRNFYLETTATPLTCAEQDRYGLMLRAVKINSRDYIGYQLRISCDGQYWFGTWDNHKYIPVVDWTSSEHLNTAPGNTNRIGVKMEGNRVTLYANGNMMAEFDAITFSEGKFGLVVGSAVTPKSTVKVDQIAYWLLP
jgi:hypothetical protein